MIKAKTIPLGMTAILVLSFAAKLVIRLVLSSNENFWQSGYSFYYQIAQNFLKSGSLYLSGGDSLYIADKIFATRPPLYPLFIAGLGALTQFSVPIFVSAEALISTFTVLAVYAITLQITGNGRSALYAGLFYAIYPYAVIHDTQLQETGLYNFFSTAAVFCLIVSISRKKIFLFFITGIILGLATLTRASHFFHSFFLAGATWFLLKNHFKDALRFTTVLLLGLFLSLSPWLIRNYQQTGSAAVCTLTGGTLAQAHNPYTFALFPYRGSIDRSTDQYRNWLKTNTDIYAQLKGADEVTQGKKFKSMALDYIQTHKLQTFWRGLYKVLVNFLGILSPVQDSFKNTIYFSSYWFLTLLALFSLRLTWKTAYLKIFLTLCLSQAVFSFIFWAHTSHRSFLDPLLAVLAGIGWTSLFPRKDESVHS